jgi:plastocyanin
LTGYPLYRHFGDLVVLLDNPAICRFLTSVATVLFVSDSPWAWTGDRRERLGPLALPRILFVVPGLLAGLLIPALTAAPKAAPESSVGMVNENFAQSSVTIKEGARLVLVNDSRLVHVIGPGFDQHVYSPQRGDPVLGFHLMQTNAIFTTGRWMSPGTYYLTCTVHPGMNLKVVVTP